MGACRPCRTSFSVLDPDTGKHVVVSGKQNIVRVENMEDNNDDVNQFEEMPLFTNLMNIKNIKKALTRIFAIYAKRWQWKICIFAIYAKRWQWKICMKLLYHISY
jgi:hypothetical protein